MREFPESSISHRKIFAWADIGPGVKPAEVESQIEKEPLGQKVWQFKSPNKYQLNIQSGSLDISSNYHKTYDLDGGNKFRDIIKLVMDNFLQTISLPTINRIGLRYVDECPIPSKDTKVFKSWYNSVFPLGRFNLSDALEMDFKTCVKRGNHYVRYIESVQKSPKGEDILILDFDGFTHGIEPKQYLTVTDKLHKTIDTEWRKTIKSPVIDYMRIPKEQ
jgi:uncharacterized protein (TIGR04255 family)